MLSSRHRRSTIFLAPVSTSSRAFTLIQFMVYMPLFAIFLILASKLFLQSNMLMTGVAEAQERRFLADAAIHQLRLDAWQSTGAEISNQVLTLHSPQGEIIWSISDEDAVIRTAMQDDRATLQFPQITQATFFLRPGAVILRLNEQHYFFRTGFAKPLRAGMDTEVLP